MDWIDEAEREVVERILVLLALLRGCAGHAGSVDRIARLPLLMRLPVLLALSRAEAAAQSWLAGLSIGLPALADATALDTGAWSERLAARLQALAAVLTIVLARRACEAPPQAGDGIRRILRSLAPRSPAASRLRGPAPLPAPDTS
jgi:hypothetical protein